jgi:LuxR family transcriptional regulator, maltose regulon positive regulatory protein
LRNVTRMKSEDTSLPFPGLIATKLHPQQIRTNIVHRKRLCDKIGTTPAKLILVAAPAGFGKTTFIIDWLKETKINFAWLSLDESDNDPRRFYQYFISALRTIDTSFGKKLIPALRSSSVPSFNVLLTVLINELLHYENDITIVLDDYYFIEEREIHHALGFFIEHLPSNVRLLIATRIDPLLPLHRMRVRGELIELRERDLRFTPDEAREFFEKLHIHLSGDDVNLLAARTEGWIAGLQLAAASLHDVKDVKKYLESFSGTNKYILDYLLEEVLNRQSKEVQMFLLQTSVLTRFNADICNMITGGMNAQKILEYLGASNLFLIPLDDRREWYRYHHLFSDLLQFRLRHLFPGLVEELHHNASIWYEERNEINEAINYALKVKNFERAAYLLDLHGIRYLSRSELSTLINYERKIPSPLIEQYPRLLVTKAWALMLMHRIENIDHILDLAERKINNPDISYSSEEILSAEWHIATIRAFMLRLKGYLRESLDASIYVLRNIYDQEPMVYGLLQFNIGRIYMKQCYAEKAIEIFESAFHVNLNERNYYVTLAILAHTGSLYSITETLDYAREKLEHALQFAEEKRLSLLPAAGYIYYQLGKVLYHQNELDRAITMLERAIELGELGNEPDIICNALIAASWIYAIKQEEKRARSLFARAEEIEKNKNVPIYEVDIEVEHIAVNFLLGKYDGVPVWIEDIDAAFPDDFTVIDEDRILLIIRFLIHTARFDDALSLMIRIRAICRERGRNHILLQLDVLEALALWGLGRKTPAIKMLQRGLEEASRMGYKRVLLNIGKPLFSLLSSIRLTDSLSPVAGRFAEELLTYDDSSPAKEHTHMPKYKQDLIDPLTEREQEVLYHISLDSSNKDIANKLFVSLDTVKTHLKHIYGKLAVNNRKEAVRKARELGML